MCKNNFQNLLLENWEESGFQISLLSMFNHRPNLSQNIFYFIQMT